MLLQEELLVTTITFLSLFPRSILVCFTVCHEGIVARGPVGGSKKDDKNPPLLCHLSPPDLYFSMAASITS